MEYGQLELEEDKATAARRALREQKLKELGQLDGQFDPIDDCTEAEENMQLDSPLDEYPHQKMIVDNTKFSNIVLDNYVVLVEIYNYIKMFL